MPALCRLLAVFVFDARCSSRGRRGCVVVVVSLASSSRALVRFRARRVARREARCVVRARASFGRARSVGRSVVAQREETPYGRAQTLNPKPSFQETPYGREQALEQGKPVLTPTRPKP